MCTIADREQFAIRQAAEMWLIYWESAYDSGRWAHPAVRASYDMAVEILAALLDIDAPPAKAQLDREITRFYHDDFKLTLPPPNITTHVSFDAANDAGVDGTLRDR